MRKLRTLAKTRSEQADVPKTAAAEGRDSIVWNIWLSDAERSRPQPRQAECIAHALSAGWLTPPSIMSLTTSETLDVGELKLPSRAARRVSVRVNSATKLHRLTAAFEARYGARHAHAFTTASIISTVVRSYRARQMRARRHG